MEDHEAIAAYVNWAAHQRSFARGSIDKYTRVLRHWADFDVEPLHTRTPEQVEQFTARPRRGGAAVANATVANEVAVLGSFYRWAAERLGWPHNPAALAGRPRVHNRQPRAIDDDTWLQLWTSDLSPDARVCVGLGFYTGLRREEVTNLHGSQVWGRALVNFTRKGGGEDRFDYGDLIDHWTYTMPHLEATRLEAPLARLARDRGELPIMPWGAWVAPRAINKRWARWMEGAGLPAQLFTPHALRHSFATNLLRSGVPLHLACDLCNHSSPAITMRYVRTSGGQLAQLRTASFGAVGAAQ